MKAIYLWVGIALVVAGAGTWIGRSVWREHHNLVTLRVRNAPLADVIRKLESQTHEKINVDRRLDGLITADMKNQPLSAVLDRVAEQAGASWRTVYAVYDSAPALRDLESVLYGDRKLEEAGWKTIAPVALHTGSFDPAQLANLPGLKGMIVTNGHSVSFVSSNGGPGRIVVRRNGDKTTAFADGGGEVALSDNQAAALPLGAKLATEDVMVDAGGAGPAKRTGERLQGAPAVFKVVRKRADGSGTTVEEEVWTPVEIVLESRLSPKLTDFSGAPTAESATRAAQQVKGKVKTYYALRKSPLGMGMAGMSFDTRKLIGSGGGGKGGMVKLGGTNMAAGIPSTPDLEAAVSQRRANELGKLTPEQRVQRARERATLNTK